MGHPAGTTDGNCTCASVSIVLLLSAIWSELSGVYKGHEAEAKGSCGKAEELLWLYLENVFLEATELSWEGLWSLTPFISSLGLVRVSSQHFWDIWLLLL